MTGCDGLITRIEEARKAATTDGRQGWAQYSKSYSQIYFDKEF